jgi:N-acetyl-gamma-glutamyl-phosphate reductase
MKKVCVIGGSGYTGGELIRLILQHPALELDFAYSTTRAGKSITTAHPDLLGSMELSFTNTVNPEVDVLYLCLGHGKSKDFLRLNTFSEKTLIVDLGNDFRLEEDCVFQDKTFIYGLPELQKDQIEKATAIANPGCFATAIQLALLPLAKNKHYNDPIHINATTGSTGAGVSLSSTSHFSWRTNNLSWYKPFKHQHLGEIHRTLNQLEAPAKLLFMPQRGAFARGIFATAYTSFEGTLEEAVSLYQDFYAQAPFTHISNDPISLKSVVNTNNCFIHLHLHDNTLLLTSCIDNLVKGASGQAIQNTNLMMGWEETLGLELKATFF